MFVDGFLDSLCVIGNAVAYGPEAFYVYPIRHRRQFGYIAWAGRGHGVEGGDFGDGTVAGLFVQIIHLKTVDKFFYFVYRGCDPGEGVCLWIADADGGVAANEAADVEL